MRGKRTLIGMAALLAFAWAGAGASVAGSPTPFAVDPEAQYMLDVGIRQLRLGEGVRGYPTPEGACLVLGDMINVLDVPLTIDLAAKKATGWAFREDHKLDIDAASAEESPKPRLDHRLPDWRCSLRSPWTASGRTWHGACPWVRAPGDWPYSRQSSCPTFRRHSSAALPCALKAARHGSSWTWTA